ncbi:alpha/beta fold hydrolase [Kitasatospora griseola]|uniref:alpha/beta fold hydrolase n=1 Tax=Kitasatospora griseola TaxID=2064 RepID=UPI0037F67DBA
MRPVARGACHPVTDASFDTPSYHRFGTGCARRGAGVRPVPAGRRRRGHRRAAGPSAGDLRRGRGPELTKVLAVTQRPLAAAAFGGAAPNAARRTRPSRGVVATADRTLNPEVQRFGYRRAGTTTVELDTSHLMMLSQPARVAEVIREEVRSVTG